MRAVVLEARGGGAAGSAGRRGQNRTTGARAATPQPAEVARRLRRSPARSVPAPRRRRARPLGWRGSSGARARAVGGEPWPRPPHQAAGASRVRRNERFVTGAYRRLVDELMPAGRRSPDRNGRLRTAAEPGRAGRGRRCLRAGGAGAERGDDHANGARDPAMAAAANAAWLSVWQSTNSTPERPSAWMSSLEPSPPGTPNTAVTPLRASSRARLPGTLDLGSVIRREYTRPPPLSTVYGPSRGVGCGHRWADVVCTRTTKPPKATERGAGEPEGHSSICWRSNRYSERPGSQIYRAPRTAILNQTYKGGERSLRRSWFELAPAGSPCATRCACSKPTGCGRGQHTAW